MIKVMHTEYNSSRDIELVCEKVLDYKTSDVECCSCEDVYKIAESLHITRATEEHVLTICLDNAGVRAVFNTHTGSKNCCMVDMGVMYRQALLVGASAIIMVHNHPSGDLSPSMEDDETCSKLLKAGKLLDIRVLDFVIVTDGIYSSYRDMEKLK